MFLGKKSKGALGLTLAFALVFSAVLAPACAAVTQTEIDELQQRKEALEERILEQQEKVDQLNESKALFIDRKAALDAQIELNREEIQLISDQIQVYDQLIQEKEQELSEAMEAEQTQSSQLRVRMRAMEENGALSYMAVLFEAESLPDLLSRIADVMAIMEYDRELEQTYQDAREDVEAIKEDYEAIQQEQEKVKEELDRKEAQLAVQVEAAYTMIANLDQLAENAQAEYAAIAAAEEETAAQLDELSRQLAAQEAAAWWAAQQAAQGSAGAAGTGTGTGTSTATGTGTGTGAGTGTSGGTGASSGGSLIWPTDSTYITSDFGNRDAPTAGASTNHQGLDIGAAAGTPIYAAASGTIELATSNSSYGNYVMVNHGSGTTTVYAHMESMTVSSGQYVTQGQIIGYVGSTGITTGPHLHYEVRVDGTRVDPSQYY